MLEENDELNKLYSHSDNFNNILKKIITQILANENNIFSRLGIIEYYLTNLPNYQYKGLQKTECSFSYISEKINKQNKLVSEIISMEDSNTSKFEIKNEIINDDKSKEISKFNGKNNTDINKENNKNQNESNLNLDEEAANKKKNSKAISDNQNDSNRFNSVLSNTFNVMIDNLSKKFSISNIVNQINSVAEKVQQNQKELSIDDNKSYSEEDNNENNTNNNNNIENNNNNSTNRSNSNANLSNYVKKFREFEDQLDEIRKELKLNKGQIFRLNQGKLDEIDKVEKSLTDKIFAKTLEINELNNKLSMYDLVLNDIKIKVMDFNIYDQLANNTGGTGNTDSSQFLTLLKNLDQKTFKKFDNYDIKIKEVENTIKKVQNDSLVFPKNVDELNKAIDVLKKDSQKYEISNYEAIKLLEDKISEQTQQVKLLKEFKINAEDKFTFLENNLGENVQSPNYSNTNRRKTFNTDDIDEQKFKSLLKKVSDIEKILNQTLNSGIIEQMQEKLESHKQKFLQKADTNELKDIRDAFSSLVGQIEYLKDEISVLSDTRKVFDEINFLGKKVENISAVVNGMKNSEQAAQLNKKQNYNSIDVSRFVEHSSLNEFKDTMKNEFKTIDYIVSNMKRLFEEMNSTVITKASNTDLKAAEDYFMAKLEESKALSVKRFSDRIDTGKNFKYLETLIKNIQDQVNKRMERGGDNWLLAKKPVDSFTCASCEGYLGELKEPDVQFKKVKKLPNIPEDKLFRSGAGYSKLLEIIGESNEKQSIEPITNKKIIKDGLSKSQFKEDSGAINLNNTISGKKVKKENGINVNANTGELSEGHNFKIGNDSVNPNFSAENDNHIVKIVKINKKNLDK